MKTSSITLVILATLAITSTGCVVGRSVGSGFVDMVQFRTELSETKRELREAELEAQRLELQNLRRAELNEIKKSQVKMVPQLETALSTTINQQVRNLVIRPNYKVMAQISMAMNQLEEENEKKYQEELTAWVKGQSHSNVNLTAFRRPFCKLHGHGCDCCPVEPDCSEPPEEDNLTEMPQRQKLPPVDIPMTVEFSVRQSVEGAEFLFANPGEAPFKEPCLPKEIPCTPCDGEACAQSTSGAAGTGLYRVPSSAPVPNNLKTLPVRTDIKDDSSNQTPPVPVPVVPVKLSENQTVMNPASYRNPLRQVNSTPRSDLNLAAF